MKRKLDTVKDGRLFAIQLLRDIKKAARQSTDDPFSCCERADEEIGAYVMPPQTTIIRDAFDRVYAEATAEAKRGFWIVITDAFGSSYTVGSMRPETYCDLEREGRMRETP